MWLRKTRPNMERPYKMWLYPLPAFLAFGGWIFLLVTTEQKMLAFGAVVLVLGVTAFLILAKVARRWPFAPSASTMIP